MKLKWPLLLIGILLTSILLAGCATRYEVKVDALRSSSWNEGKPVYYDIESGMPEIGKGDLFFQEVESIVSAALEKQGYIKKVEGEKAKVRLSIKAYLSEPMTETEVRSEPVFVNHRPRARVIATPVLNSEGKVVRYIYTEYLDYSASNYATTYRERERQITVYDKVLELAATIERDSEEREEIWTIRMSMRDRSTDLRGALPVLLEAGRPYIGLRTEGEILIFVKEDELQKGGA